MEFLPADSERIARQTQDRAQAALLDSNVFDLRDLRVEFVEDSLILSGSVSSFYHKQLAQETVRAVVREIAVVNSIRVK